MYKTLNSRGMMIAIIVLFSVVIFILLMHLIAKWYWRYARLHMARTAGRTQQRLCDSGLDQSFIDSLPTFKYHMQPSSDDAKSLSSSSHCECAVCLSEFQEAEKGRTLPGCNHSFHVDCIDMWLHSHSTCPLCRADVLMSFKPIKEQTNCAQDSSSLPVLPVSMLTMPGSTSSSLTSTVITSSPMPLSLSTMPRSSSLRSTILPSSPMQSPVLVLAVDSDSALAPVASPSLDPNLEQICSNETRIDHVISISVTPRTSNGHDSNNNNNNNIFFNEDINPSSEDNYPGILPETETESPPILSLIPDISIDDNPASKQHPWQIVRCLSMPRSCNANMYMELSPNSHPAKRSRIYRQSFKLGRQWSSKGGSIRV